VCLQAIAVVLHNKDSRAAKDFHFYMTRVCLSSIRVPKYGPFSFQNINLPVDSSYFRTYLKQSYSFFQLVLEWIFVVFRSSVIVIKVMRWVKGEIVPVLEVLNLLIRG